MFSTEHHHILGQGSFGSVFLAQDSSNKPVAVKAISKNSTQKVEDVQREIEAGRMLHHKNLVKLIETCEDERCWYIVMEYIKGETLFDFVEKTMEQNNGELNLSQNVVRKILKQLISGIDFCHKKGVCHLDLKLENIMIHENDVKIIDFGLCNISNDITGLCTKFAGSMDYLAPEILRKRPYRGDKADVWSLGVILYVLLMGQMPFGRDDRFGFVEKQKEHPPVIWDSKRKVPKMAQDLVDKMLKMEPRDRPTISQVKKHPWLSLWIL